MAGINLKTIRKIDKERNTVHSKVNASYSVFNADGKRFIQIDTYGKDGRMIPEKISQSLQIDEEFAKFLIELIVREFKV